MRFFAAPEPVPVTSFRAAFEAVRDGSVGGAVVPVESSLLGTIRENLDLLWEFELPVVGEVSVPVRLALLARAGRAAGVDHPGLLDLGGAGPGRRVPAFPAVDGPDLVQHGRCGTPGRGGGRARGRRGRLGAGRRDLRAPGARRRHPVRHRQPDAVRRDRRSRSRGGPRRPGRRPAGRRRGPAPDVARVRGPERAGLAVPVARGVRHAGAQPVAAREPAVDGADGHAGSTCSGWTSTATRRTPPVPRRWTTLERESELVRILGTYPRAPED